MDFIQFDSMVTETDLSRLFAFDDKKVWIPKSLSGEPDFNDDTIEVETWFLEQEELEDYIV